MWKNKTKRKKTVGRARKNFPHIATVEGTLIFEIFEEVIPSG
jgi:hypothetical protein